MSDGLRRRDACRERDKQRDSGGDASGGDASDGDASDGDASGGARAHGSRGGVLPQQ